MAVCSLLIIIVLSIGAIVLSLIPVYISNKDISSRNTSKSQFQIIVLKMLVYCSFVEGTISVGYATNVINGRSLTLANIDSISTQV